MSNCECQKKFKRQKLKILTLLLNKTQGLSKSKGENIFIEIQIDPNKLNYNLTINLFKQKFFYFQIQKKFFFKLKKKIKFPQK